MRQNPPQIWEGVTTRHRFGLPRATPGDTPFHIGVLRGEREIVIEIRPRRMAGGYAVGFKADPQRSRAYFERQP